MLKWPFFNLSRRGLLAGGAATAAAMARPRIAASGRVETVATPMMTVRFNVNGEKPALSLDPRTSLLDALREHLHLTGPKKAATTASVAPAL